MRYSLKTGYIGLAKSKARLLAGLIQHYFRKIRELSKLKSLSDKDIQWLVMACKDLGLSSLNRCEF